MMSLKPRNVDFQETWANLRETVAGVVALKGVQRSEWNTRFSDVYALCVAHPEPLAERLLDETRAFLEQHVAGLLRAVCADTPLHAADHGDGLLHRYVQAWREYSEGAAYLNCLYSYLNLQHVKRQKVSDAEIMYGGSGAGAEEGARQLEVGALALELWERGVLGPLGAALSARLVRALAAARDEALEPALAAVVRDAVLSTVKVRAHRVRAPLQLYEKLVLEPHLAASEGVHSRRAAALLEELPVAEYAARAGTILAREADIAAQYLHASSCEPARRCAERACVAAHLPALHAACGGVLRAALDAPPHRREQCRRDLRNLHRLLAPLGPAALKPLVDCAHDLAAQEGHAAAATHNKDDAHIQFVNSMLALHTKYSELFNDVFTAHQPFQGALDKACSEVVNARSSPEGPARAPELLARYCDTLLRKKSGGECDTEEKLSAAITVFKYVDDKDVFQKYYARALARRLIHQLSASMEQEEAMINRLKAACGYEFTNKLHRMFTDVQVSHDLNTKFQRHLAQAGRHLDTGFFIQVLQAGAWPLGGAMAPLAPPLQLERAARLFDAFYRRSFSGRRLAWLHHLCTGELRTRYTPRLYHVTATTHQCAILLCFESCDTLPAGEVQSRVSCDSDSEEDTWRRHLRPLLDAGLLTEQGDVLALNLAFSCKRTKIRLTAANLPPPNNNGAAAASAATETEAVTTCDDDRKMYLQAALVRIMKQRKVLRHTELIQEVVSQARGSFAPSVHMIKKCIEALIDKQYLERTPAALDTYSYLA